MTPSSPDANTLVELAERRQMSGYFGCCGRSRIRGHWELCPHAIRARAAAESAK
jgi:hypothetical protein